ncbi:hypothetical protein ACLI4Z_09125 [Natrialbaceae archaeon A-arb3/5]
MREHKDNIFYYESGEIADPLEKNTVHGLVKTLQDTKPSITKNVLEFCIEQSIPESVSYDYRTEIPAKAASPDSSEERILIGLSRTGGVRDGGGAGDSPQVDARIRIKTPDGTTLYSVFIEAKVQGNDLQRGQLEDYVEAYNISEQDGERPQWNTIQWSDVYRLFEKNRELSLTHSEPSRDAYLLREFNHRLLQKNMVRGTLGISKSGGQNGEKHRKRLLVGPKDPDGEPVLTFWAFSRRDSQDQSSSMEVPQHCLQELFGQMDYDTRREVFIEGDLMALQEWAIQTTDLVDSDFKEAGSTFARAEREGYSEPAGIMLRFSSGNHFKINSENLEKSNGWIYYPPILVPHEWETVFTELSEKLSENQQRRFIEDFDLDALWEAYLNR